MNIKILLYTILDIFLLIVLIVLMTHTSSGFIYLPLIGVAVPFGTGSQNNILKMLKSITIALIFCIGITLILGTFNI